MVRYGGYVVWGTFFSVALGVTRASDPPPSVPCGHGLSCCLTFSMLLRKSQATVGATFFFWGGGLLLQWLEVTRASNASVALRSYVFLDLINWLKSIRKRNGMSTLAPKNRLDRFHPRVAESLARVAQARFGRKGTYGYLRAVCNKKQMAE